MKVIFLKSPTGSPFRMAYNVGDQADVTKEKAQAMIDAGIAADFAEVSKREKATSKKATTAEKSVKK